jgi:hypothetical protein
MKMTRSFGLTLVILRSQQRKRRRRDEILQASRDILNLIHFDPKYSVVLFLAGDLEVTAFDAVCTLS